MDTARWTAHPVKRRPRDGVLVAAVVLLTAGAVLASLESPLLTVLAVVILLASVSPFLFPTHYALSEHGVEERRLLRRKSRRWADLRRLEVGARAALVSPFARPRWLDRYRGITVMFDGGDRERVIAILRARIEGADAAASADPDEEPERADDLAVTER